MKYSFYVGDAIEILRTLPDESVHCVVTSPPYWGLRDYGVEGQIGHEKTPEEYVEKLVQVFREVKRVLRKDGTVWLNLGDSYAGDKIAGGNDKDKMYPGNPEALRIRRRLHIDHWLKPKDLVGIPWRVAFALQADGWWLRSDIIWAKPNAMPESVKDRPTKSHEYIFLLTKSAKYFYDAEAVKEPANYDGSGAFHTSSKKYENINQRNARPHKRWQANESGDIVKNRRSVWWIPTKPFPGAHFATFPPDLVEICIKAGTSEYGCCPKCGAPWERVTEVVDIADYGGLRKRADAPGAEVSPTSVFRTGKVPIRKTVGWRPTCSCGIDEVVPCTVLDPFGGSGTTTLVAHQLGRNSIYIDLNPEYEQMARKRLLDAVGDSLVLAFDNVLYVQSNKQLKIALDEFLGR